jgi:hypothetical protein
MINKGNKLMTEVATERLGRGERQEPDNDLCHPRSRRPFLWHRSAPQSFSQCR